MSPLAIATLAFAAVFGSALGGMLLRSKVPEHHISPESKDVVKLAMGLIATMAALVLGLLTGSAKSSFDAQDNEIKQMAANIIVLDRLLAQYGTETQEARGQIRGALTRQIARLWPEEGAAPASPETGKPDQIETIESTIRGLTPQSDTQRALQTHALNLTDSLSSTRWLVFAQSSSALPVPFLIMLQFWLAVLFASFGLFAPRNAPVIGALFLCAVSVSGSLFLILEMSRPLQGMVKISSAPLGYALAHIGQ